MTREALPDGTVLEERAYDEDGLLVAKVNDVAAVQAGRVVLQRRILRTMGILGASGEADRK
jgi:hypothetical protein